jgi:L-threonylcarbamoyladenylate synthase
MMDDQIAAAAGLIRRGEVVAFPTETVFGLGANALDAGAVAKIYRIKERPPTSPLIVHVDSLEMARKLVIEWSAAANELARRWWPGPLTIVLKKSHVIPDVVTAGLQTVGLRMPAHPVALKLIGAAGVPIAAPSANPFTRLSPTRAQHVRELLGGKVALVLDGDPPEVGIESTVISLADPQPSLLRPGMIPRAELEEVLGPVRVAGVQRGAHASPGLHERHYRPRTPVILGDPPRAGRGAYLYRTSPCGIADSIRMPAEPGPYGARLYEELHSADAKGYDWIAIEPPPEHPAWEGIADRLRRASR